MNNKLPSQRTADWLDACEVGRSNREISTQFGCMVEEIAETLAIAPLKCRDEADRMYLNSKCKAAVNTLDEISALLKDGALQIDSEKAKNQFVRELLLDGLCDISVTVDGFAHLMGFDKAGADREVLRSNDSKLVDGKAEKNPKTGKIIKPESYSPPNLTEFI